MAQLALLLWRWSRLGAGPRQPRSATWGLTTWWGPPDRGVDHPLCQDPYERFDDEEGEAGYEPKISKKTEKENSEDVEDELLGGFGGYGA